MRVAHLLATGICVPAALVGFAEVAAASATIDLIWADTGTETIENVDASDLITLLVILTAGPNGSSGAAVSVDYSQVVGVLTVSSFQSLRGGSLPVAVGTTVDTGSSVSHIQAGSLPPYVGTGLTSGESHMLGTITFHREASAASANQYPLSSYIDPEFDTVFDLDGNVISGSTTFNEAYLIIGAEVDLDADGVGDRLDNCSERANPAQDDTDGDSCGNICDADYDNSGIVGQSDFGIFARCFDTNNELCQHVEPIGAGRRVGFPDFGYFVSAFAGAPGPSGTTAGTPACP